MRLVGILVPPIRNRTWAAEVEVQSPNHWTVREFPLCLHLLTTTPIKMEGPSHIPEASLSIPCFSHHRLVLPVFKLNINGIKQCVLFDV